MEKNQSWSRWPSKLIKVLKIQKSISLQLHWRYLSLCVYLMAISDTSGTFFMASLHGKCWNKYQKSPKKVSLRYSGLSGIFFNLWNCWFFNRITYGLLDLIGSDVGGVMLVNGKWFVGNVLSDPLCDWSVYNCVSTLLRHYSMSMTFLEEATPPQEIHLPSSPSIRRKRPWRP